MRAIASIFGVLSAALAVLAVYLLHEAFAIDFTVGPEGDQVANLSLMHVQTIVLACGLVAALSGVVMIAASGIVWAMVEKAKASSGR